MKFLPTRNDLGSLLKPGAICAEIGVWRGYFSVQMLQWPVEKLVLVDAWRRQVWSADEQVSDEEHEKNYAETMYNVRGSLDRVVVMRMTSAEAAKMFPVSYFDLVNIDACHDYPHVTEDLTLWGPLVKPDGFLCGHDYTKNADAKKWGFGVVEAVDDFCIKSEWEMTHLTQEDFASYVLQRRNWEGAEV
jgi:Methyltransferase domain